MSHRQHFRFSFHLDPRGSRSLTHASWYLVRKFLHLLLISMAIWAVPSEGMCMSSASILVPARTERSDGRRFLSRSTSLSPTPFGWTGPTQRVGHPPGPSRSQKTKTSLDMDSTGNPMRIRRQVQVQEYPWHSGMPLGTSRRDHRDAGLPASGKTVWLARKKSARNGEMLTARSRTASTSLPVSMVVLSKTRMPSGFQTNSSPV